MSEAFKQGLNRENVFTEAELAEAERNSGDLTLEPMDIPTPPIREAVNDAAFYNVGLPSEHFTPSEEIKKTADEVLESDASRNLLRVESNPDRLTLTDVPTKTDLTEATYDRTADLEQNAISTDPNNRTGRSFAAPLPTRTPAPAPQKKSLIDRLLRR